MKSLEERFWQKVDFRVDGDACWEWLASKNEKGYGQFFKDGKMARAHRVSYEMKHGNIPQGFEIDHVCRNRACVNPEHLEVVTRRENNERAGERRTHCANGHRYDDSTYLNKAGARVCKTCNLEKGKRWREKQMNLRKQV